MVTTEISISSRDARQEWSQILDDALSGAKDYLVMRYGKPCAAVIPAQDYRALKDELHKLRIEREAEVAYRQWKSNPELARPYDELREELGLSE